MINQRLIRLMTKSRKNIAGHVLFQWLSLAANILVMFTVASLMEALAQGTVERKHLVLTVMITAAALAVRFGCMLASSRLSYLSSKEVKQTLRTLIFEKLLRLGSSYKERVNTSEVVQVCVEGVDQLETYFGAYLPQFFYAMAAPITLFVVLSTISLPCAFVLFVCVPLIPIAIIAVQRWAKKLLSKYWDRYTGLGDTFLENLQGLTTLKIYQADAYKQEQMNKEAEDFRKITMRVLTMQLNSISIMDLIAYGGAGLGVILSVWQFSKGSVSLSGCLVILLLSADFFLPMRQLGSFFHIAMNGMAAADKIFKLLDLPEPAKREERFPEKYAIACRNLYFSYEKEREILHDISFDLPEGGFIAIVGESGCGKSTIASILTGRNQYENGLITIGHTELKDIDERELLKNITMISHNSLLFKGSIRENLRMGNPYAGDEELLEVLKRVKLSDFSENENGLDTKLTEQGANFSGGQRQRLALARALLHDSPIYIFDEATSNIDAESENDIMEQIRLLAKTKTVLLISHRLANVRDADRILVMEQGRIVESGTHPDLLAQNGTYASLWNTQDRLENYKKEVQA